MDADSIAASLARITDAVRATEAKYGRASGSVKLLAVSKTRPAAVVAGAFAAGQTAFGESYVQEGKRKIKEVGNDAIEWHFIGPVQSNKTRAIASLFSWIHSVDQEAIARRLSHQRPPGLAALNICIQVNISGEKTKSGTSPGEVGKILAATTALPGIRVRGLMAIPAPASEVVAQRQAFATMKRIFDEHCGAHQLDTLSMGMSGDFKAAIAEGATMVRLGTAIFGTRDATTQRGL